MGTFEPKIIGFCCNWCSYAGADLAGVSRFQYPTNLRVVRVMCSGRVDPSFIFSSFLAGFDGVMVLGCHLGDCHYLTGNYHAEKKMQMVEKLLGLASVERKRFILDWVSAAEGERFARIVTEFANKIKEVGPLEKDESLILSLKAARVTTQGEKVRWLVGNELDLLEKGNVFREKILTNEFSVVMDTLLRDEYKKNEIALLLEKIPYSVREIADCVRLSPQQVSSYLVDLEDLGMISLHSIAGKTPKYIRAGR